MGSDIMHGCEAHVGEQAGDPFTLVSNRPLVRSDLAFFF